MQAGDLLFCMNWHPKYCMCICVYVLPGVHSLLCYPTSLSVGNKNDCPEKKVVQTEDAKTFSEQIGVDLFETSAKENINVEEVSES